MNGCGLNSWILRTRGNWIPLRSQPWNNYTYYFVPFLLSFICFLKSKSVFSNTFVDMIYGNNIWIEGSEIALVNVKMKGWKTFNLALVI